MEQRDSERPGDHPGPPAHLANHQLPIREFSHAWVRVHKDRHDPIFFGRTGNNRFDAPDGSFGVMYVGMDVHCAVVETIELLPFGRLIAVSSLAAMALARVETNRPLRLVDLTADGLVRLGADARLTTGRYSVSQRWSLALWNHPSAPDGLLYRSRHDPSRLSAAIFDRAAGSITATRLGAFASEPVQHMLQQVFVDYGYILVDD